MDPTTDEWAQALRMLVLRGTIMPYEAAKDRCLAHRLKAIHLAQIALENAQNRLMAECHARGVAIPADS